MRSFDYAAIGVLIVCMLAGTKALSVDAGSLVIAVADVAQAVAPDPTQSPLTEEGEVDLLNLLD